MRKQDLIRAVARQTSQPESQVTSTVNAVFAQIQQSLSEGNEVVISGFGAFRVVERSARQGRSPRTGEPMTIPARKSPAFRPGAELKRTVSGD
ncbi:MAG: HU family DNA-binding protein [Thermomicrobiales bacterium]